MGYNNFVLWVFIVAYAFPAFLMLILTFTERWGDFEDMTVGDLVSNFIINPLIPLWNFIVGYLYLCHLISTAYFKVRDYKPFERLPKDGS